MPGTTVEDLELVARAQKGDVAAFTALVARYETRVYNLAYRLVSNPDDAADVAQEAFLAAYTSLGRFRAESSFYTWLYRIAVNKALTQRASRDSRKEFAAAGRGLLAARRGHRRRQRPRGGRRGEGARGSHRGGHREPTGRLSRRGRPQGRRGARVRGDSRGAGSGPRDREIAPAQGPDDASRRAAAVPRRDALTKEGRPWNARE